MFTFDKLSRRPRLFQRMTGLTLEEFTDVFDKFQSSWQFFIRSEFLSKERKRAYGGGRHTRLLSLEDKLLNYLNIQKHKQAIQVIRREHDTIKRMVGRFNARYWS